MPPYATSGQGTVALNTALPTVLQQGDDFYPFGTAPYTPGAISKPNDTNVQFESVSIGERSIAWTIDHGPAQAPRSLFVQAFASANPGAAEIDIQDAGIDADGAYATPATGNKLGTTWTQVGASGVYTAQVATTQEVGKFSSLKVIANPNAVQFWVKVNVQ